MSVASGPLNGTKVKTLYIKSTRSGKNWRLIRYAEVLDETPSQRAQHVHAGESQLTSRETVKTDSTVESSVACEVMAGSRS